MKLKKIGSEFDPCSALLVFLVKLERKLEHLETPGSVNLNEVGGEGGLYGG